jgi:hypothetical protein
MLDYYCALQLFDTRHLPQLSVVLMVALCNDFFGNFGFIDVGRD